MNLADRLEAARGRPAPVARRRPPRPAAVRRARRRARPSAPAAAPPTDALARLKDRVGKALFERMGSRLNDPSLSEDALRTLVLGELDEVVEEENVPLSTEERQRLTAEVADDVLGYGPLQRLLDDPTVTEIMVNGPDKIYVERSGKLDADRRPVHLRGAPAPGHRAHRLPGRPAHRRVLAAGRRPPGRRLPRQRDHPAAGLQRLDADHPQVLQGPVQRRRPDRLRHAVAGDGRAAARLRRGAAEHHRLRRHRHRQDDAAQRAVVVHPRGRADRHHRGRRRAAAAAGARRPAGVPAAEHRGQGRDHHPRPGPQLAAHAARPHRRRRVPRRRERWTCCRR